MEKQRNPKTLIYRAWYGGLRLPLPDTEILPFDDVLTLWGSTYESKRCAYGKFKAGYVALITKNLLRYPAPPAKEAIIKRCVFCGHRAQLGDDLDGAFMCNDCMEEERQARSGGKQ